MRDIRSNSDKGKEIVTSSAKKLDLVKRESKEKLTLNRENEHLLGGADKGESSRRKGKKQSDKQDTQVQVTDDEVNRFFSLLEATRPQRQSKHKETYQFTMDDFKNEDKNKKKDDYFDLNKPAEK